MERGLEWMKMLMNGMVEVEEEKEDKPKTKKVEKTTWDWELLNDAKPIWTRKAGEVEDKEYIQFYKSISKDTEDPLAHVHFSAEGEVTFKSLLFIPKRGPHDMFSNYGKKVLIFMLHTNYLKLEKSR